MWFEVTISVGAQLAVLLVPRSGLQNSVQERVEHHSLRSWRTPLPDVQPHRRSPVAINSGHHHVFSGERKQEPKASPVCAPVPHSACPVPATQPPVRLFCSPHSAATTDAVPAVDPQGTTGSPPAGASHPGDPTAAAPGGTWADRLRRDPGAPPRSGSVESGRERRSIGSLYDPLLPSACLMRSTGRQ